MAVASINTHGLLNWWPVRMQENLYRWNQLDGNLARHAQPGGFGSYVYVQSEREPIALAIQQVIAPIQRHFRFLPRPTYVTEQIRINGDGEPLYTTYGYVQQLGKRAVTLIQSGVSVSYSNDTATVTVSTSVTDPSEIHLFFRVVDGATAVASDLWRIEPLAVTISGGMATIKGHRALFANPSIWAQELNSPGNNASDKNVGDADVSDSYVTAVDIYRVYPDTTDAVKLLTGQGSSNATSLAQSIQWNDLRFGELELLEDGAGILEISYLAGYPLLNGEIDPVVRTAILQMANCELNLTLGVFEPARLTILQWDTMVETINNAPAREKETPFGRKRGQIQAWRSLGPLSVQHLMMGL